MMERENLIRFFEEHDRLLEPGALDLIMKSGSPMDLSNAILSRAHGQIFITRTMVDMLLEVPPPQKPVKSFEMISQGYTPPVKSEVPLDAYRELFNDRFTRLARLLRGKSELKNVIKIGDLPRCSSQEVSIIGMVKDQRLSKEHHLLLTVDDLSGEATVLVPANLPSAKEPFLSDEVVGMRLWTPREEGRISYVREVVRPGLPLNRDPPKVTTNPLVLFISDIHVGSKMFMRDAWKELTAFLRGNSVEPEMAKRIRHVVIAGDMVDGIGIYPGQEKDLAITDIVEQYAELGRLLKEFPENLNIVAIPGNHDAVCPAEPQPAIGAELSELLPPNVRVAGNPSLFALEGVMVEAYHGRSFDDIIPNIPSACYERPVEVMKRMLWMRHLSPTFGQKIPLAPLPRDGMVLDPLPDILVTGHTHTCGVERYRGILLMNASAWISETDYQRMRNVKPSPAQAFVVNLSNHAVKQISFLGNTPQLAE
jgi:DNA polymerase II small subunit